MLQTSAESAFPLLKAQNVSSQSRGAIMFGTHRPDQNNGNTDGSDPGRFPGEAQGFGRVRGQTSCS